jgi:hypothetical protein
MINIVSESFMPITPSQKMAQMQGFFQFMGAIPPEMMTPELTQMLADQFNMPQRVIPFGTNYANALGHVEIFKTIADAIIDQFGDVPTYDLSDPTVLQLGLLVLDQANIPIVPELDNVDAMLDAFQDYWRTDSGRDAPNLLKAVLILRIEEIKQATAKMAMEDQQLAMAAQAPAMEQQQSQMAAQNEQQQAQMMAEQEAAAMQDEGDKNFQAAMKQTDLEESERQRQHELQMASAQNQEAARYEV